VSDLIPALENEKTRLTEKSSELYSASVINLEEYERLVDYINRIETKKEISVINSMIQSYSANSVGVSSAASSASAWSSPADSSPAPAYQEAISRQYGIDERTAVFSWRTTNLRPVNGWGGRFVSVFGTNRIIADNLPPGRTSLQIQSVFGLTEIIVSDKVKIVNDTQPVFSGVFGPDELNSEDPDAPELVITGQVVFGNLTIIRK